MNILLAVVRDPKELLSQLSARHSHAEIVRIDSLIMELRSGTVSRPAEAIVIDVRAAQAVTDGAQLWEAIESHGLGLQLADEIRSLPAHATMADGRRWNGVPVLIYGSTLVGEKGPREVEGNSNARWIDICTDTFPVFYERLIEMVVAYRHRLLTEFSNLGFLVFEDHGRFRVNPALGSLSEGEGLLYSRVADLREPNGYYTVDRNIFGVEYEADQFEALISRADVRERDIQEFLELHPHFITNNLSKAIPHPYFTNAKGPLIPDFVLKPIVAEQRDSRWQILDLKLPGVKLLSGPRGRPQLSHKVHQALAQLRDYRNYFAQEANSRAVQAVLGRAIKYPRLAILIGRMPNDCGVEALEQVQADESIHIVTYDEVLETQRRFPRA